MFHKRVNLVGGSNMNIKISKETDKYLICYCHKHNDKNTPNLYINKTEINGHPKGFAFCFSCGYHKDFSPEEVDTMSKKRTKHIRERRPVDWYKLTTDFIDGKGIEQTRLAERWGINPHTLFQYYVGWTGDSYSIPMRDENNIIIGLQLRYEDGSKSCIEGSQLGLFIPNILLERPVVVCEGFSDAVVATDLNFFGIGLPSASFGHGVVKNFLDNRATTTTITIVRDNDEVGKKSAEKMNKLFSPSYDCRVIVPDGCKDLRETHQNKGKEFTTKWLKGN